ncbi:TonB-dependent receptor [Hyphomonas sp. WL0036]|uniref:TonB-dependent receptor n=1 Tax=Hyphomonas sediminis TaxID=2866160 RepID=UPI001C815FB2|nr:TonB-dependent receptor [Hyphomonas sediminis]MBY9068155.1 TonB-dependent receptor [Hyphomonas sediminis]
MSFAARAARTRLAAILAATTCLSTLSLPAIADEATAGSAASEEDATATLEKVVVTARFKEETIKDIPASVTAIGSETIERGGVRNIEDVARLTPGLNFVSLGSNFALPVIRGLSTNVGESNVGMFVDGVYQGSRSGMDRPLADVERVEVIKGPQIALYGRNAFGGAINVITRAPTNTPSLNASVTLGEGGRKEGSVFASGPLVKDKLFGRVGIAAYERDGFYTNELTGGNLDTYSAKYYSGALLWQPTSSLSLDLRGNYEDSSAGDRPGYFILNNKPELHAGRSQMYLGEVPAQTDGFAVTPGGYDRETTLWSLTGKWDINDELQASSVTSYSDLEGLLQSDIDYGPADLNYQTQRIDQTWFSQEFRLARSGDTVDWLVGLYYSDQEQTDDNLQLVTNPAIENAIPASLRSVHLINVETSEVMAAFGSVTWRFAPDWSLDVAGRVFREEKHMSPFQENPYTNVVLSPNPNLSIEEDFFTPSVALSWDATDNMTLYASAAKGVKSGGFNAMANVTDSERLYDAEQSWNYELGAKTNWMDDRLTVNAALFNIEWSDQIVRALGTLGATLNANAGTTTSRGFELEVAARPTSNLDLSFSYTYTDASFDEYTFPALALSFGLDPVLDGKSLQYVPENMLTAGAQYQAPLTGDWDWFVRGDAAYRSKQYGTTTNLFWVGDQTNANLTLGFENDTWSAEFWLRNAFDEDAPTASIQQRNLGSVVLPPAGQGVFRVLSFAPEPRNAGVTLRYRF